MGFLLHLGVGQLFAVPYTAAFWLLGGSTWWWWGALFGAFHGLAVLTLVFPLLPGMHPKMASERSGPGLDAVLEPPGFLGLHYGKSVKGR